MAKVLKKACNFWHELIIPQEIDLVYLLIVGGLTLGFSRRWKRERRRSGRCKRSAANPCWAVPRLHLPGPDVQRLQYFKADLLNDSEFWPVLITHHWHPWKTLLGHGDTARPERHRIIRWNKDIRQANHIVRVISDGPSHKFLILVGNDEDNLRIGQQGWKKERLQDA